MKHTEIGENRKQTEDVCRAVDCSMRARRWIRGEGKRASRTTDSRNRGRGSHWLRVRLDEAHPIVLLKTDVEK